jgi:two-component system, chemotaxis family, protein-glutamate methylesterase/glutaminase
MAAVTRSSGKPSLERPWVVVIAASAGGVAALIDLFGGLPGDFPASIVVIQHRAATKTSLLDEILRRRTKLPIEAARPGERLLPGVAYIAPPDQHLIVNAESRFEFVDGTRVRGVLSSANPLLESAAPIFNDRLIAVVLTGSGLDATDGVQAVKACGGIVIAQDEATSLHFGMPGSAIRTGVVDRVLPLSSIAPALVELVTSQRPSEGDGENAHHEVEGVS